MSRIENQKYSIESAFNECFYLVPDYQREYIWTEKQVSLLLEDIDSQVDNAHSAQNQSEYFIGTVLVSPRDKKHFDVIDGQQRLTTLFLILCALRAMFGNNPQADSITHLIESSYTDSLGETNTERKLVPQYENAGEIIEQIVRLNNDPQSLRKNLKNSNVRIYGSVKNILRAYEIIFKFLNENYIDVERLKRYWGYLANNVVFIQISTDVGNALKIFETINERGVGLNPMDLLKNLLFTHVDTENFSRLSTEWKMITDPLEKNKEKPLRFLRYFLMANFNIRGEYWNANIREDEIYEWFSKQENADQTGYKNEPFKFVRKIKHNVDLFTNFRSGLGNDGESSAAMDSLRRLTGGGFSFHHVLLLAASNLPNPLFDEFIIQIENFLFYYIFTKTTTRDLEQIFSSWADDVRKIAHIENSEEQKTELYKFFNDHFAKIMIDKTQELKDALNRHTFNSMQKYRIRYFLAKVSQYVDMAYIGQNSPKNLDHYFNFEIEHILPSTPDANLREVWQSQNPESDYDDYKDRLGNLTLLERPMNIVASNDFYSEKVSEYAKSSLYLTKSLAKLEEVGQYTSVTRINEKLQSYDKWDAQEIEQRQSQFVTLALEVWKPFEFNNACNIIS